jgi:hypothetical protein
MESKNTLLKTPLSYPEWVDREGFYADLSQKSYLAYLNDWYRVNKRIYNDDNKAESTRQQYIQLIKDLLYLFNKEELDLFLSDVNFNNDEDLVYIIPYLANKLKQISQIISEKREEIKRTKLKDSFIGSQEGLESILYEYVLKNFTNKPYSWTRVPISSLVNKFPQLSSVSGDFYIEVEELYDTNNYHDSDPSVPINEYLDLNKLISVEPFASLSDDELSSLITSRLLLRVAETPLSKIFNQYLTLTPYLSSPYLAAPSTNYTASIYNQIAANKKYLGESVYGLTAIRTQDLNIPDYTVMLNITQGNNWFYYPSGDKITDTTLVGNIYSPIYINDSNFILNRTVVGSGYMDSDLIFTDKDGKLEGAWLQGLREVSSKDRMSVGLGSNSYTHFMFPYVGFNIDSKDLKFKSYSLNDSQKILFQKLNSNLQTQILSSYYNNTLPNSAAHSIYLNQTHLVYDGANAGYFSDEADTITLTPSANNIATWNDSIYGAVEKAFLYKFDNTDIYVNTGLNDIYWPIQSFEAGTDNITLNLSSDACLPISLAAINPSKSMVGSIAGQSFNTADIIYKFATNGSTPVEAAWLGAGSISQLNPIPNAIGVYETSAVNCAQYLSAPIQPSLSMKMESNTYNSFVWMDQDTYADEVFYYYEHKANCPFGNSFPHDFYNNQDYQNPSPLNNGKSFPLKETPCTCNAIYHSPIGSQGEKYTDYNGMCDLLFADPQGLGADFSFKNWVDTRNFKPQDSPQFSFYQLDGTMDRNVGFGTGRWKTGTDKRMVLKTGRRYTYYRHNFRVNSKSTTITPYLLVNYGYKNISLTCGSDFSDKVDLIILIDNSRTQKFNVDLVKELASFLCEFAVDSNHDILISIIAFNENGLLLNYLTNDLASLLKSINTIRTPKKYPEWLTDITKGLILANNVLFVNQPFGNNCDVTDISRLCDGLNDQIINNSNISNITNCPRRDAEKKIIIFSDGQETLDMDTAVPYSKILKENGVSILAVDVGYYALTDNKVMEEMASDNMYYNLQEYLLYSDINLKILMQNIASILVGCFPTLPVWCKAIRNSNGDWNGINTPSDMVLNAGDYIGYVHQSKLSYTGYANVITFEIPALSFTINVKLDGWDYSTHSFNLTGKGDNFSGKPFWGKTNTPSTTSFPIGGGGRIMDEYVTLHQPEVSNMILKNGNFISYNNYGDSLIRWNENLTFTVTLSDQQWNKLLISKTDSNLAANLNTINVQDLIVEQTYIPSDILLEAYSSLNAARYTFYLSPCNSPFTYTEDLYYIDRCETSFVNFTSGLIIEASYAHLNLDNINYPTVANINFPTSFVTESEIGSYLLPNKLGVPYYRGKGYSMQLDPTRISILDSLSAEYMFSDIQKYGPRNRGLTKKDQNTPVKITSIDNRWMMEPLGSGYYSGVIIETKNNQKLIPYQSNYEINQDNQIGVCLQRDNFQFWNAKYYDLWTNKDLYPLTFRNELLLENYFDRIDNLLCNVGNQIEWKTDIFGNNFSLIKNNNIDNNNVYLATEKGETFALEFGIKLGMDAYYDWLGEQGTPEQYWDDI